METRRVCQNPARDGQLQSRHPLMSLLRYSASTRALWHTEAVFQTAYNPPMQMAFPQNPRGLHCDSHIGVSKSFLMSQIPLTL